MLRGVAINAREVYAFAATQSRALDDPVVQTDQRSAAFQLKLHQEVEKLSLQDTLNAKYYYLMHNKNLHKKCPV